MTNQKPRMRVTFCYNIEIHCVTTGALHQPACVQSAAVAVPFRELWPLH